MIDRGTSEGNAVWLNVQPGYVYDLVLPRADRVPAGTRWEDGPLLCRRGGELRRRKRETGPLSPMYREPIVFKLDDLQTRFLLSWQRFCAVVEPEGGKVRGIKAGLCGREIFEWVRSLDPARFELWKHTCDHGETDANQYGHPYDVQYWNLNRHQEVILPWPERLGPRPLYGSALA